MRYEYKWLIVSPGVDPVEELNKLGAEGWTVRFALQGSLHDDVGFARVLMEREGDRKIDPTG